MNKFFVAIALISLSACSDVSVKNQHVNMALDKCKANDGLSYIISASSVEEFESCGYKCSKETGKVKYDVAFVCKNAATFNLFWIE